MLGRIAGIGFAALGALLFYLVYVLFVAFSRLGNNVASAIGSPSWPVILIILLITLELFAVMIVVGAFLAILGISMAAGGD